MEPRQSSSEQLPATPPSPEVSISNPEAAEAGPASTELGIDPRRNEQTERRLGHQVESVAQVPSQPVASVSLPAPVDDDVADTPVADDTSTPIVAADDDLIEKEWVDKAKQVISSTKDDPYRRELEVKKLQLEYIKKRYGKIIGDSGDEG